jgi:GNAT superfamily N-acetyltransferase
MKHAQIVDANLRAAMQFFGKATGTGEIQHLDGSVGIYSGLDYGVFNIGMLEREMPGRGIADRGSLGRQGSTPDLEHCVATCAKYFQLRTPRWSFWLCEDLLDRPEHRHANQIFQARDMRMISSPPGMYADTLRRPSRGLPEIECREVGGQSDRDAFAAITAVSFDIPLAVSRAVYQPDQAWAGDYRGFLGLAAGTPVAIVAIVPAAGVLGVYSLATIPEYRRRGYGEAVLRAAVEQERARTGLEHVVLQSTDAGYKLYRRLGFRDVAQFSVWLTK